MSSPKRIGVLPNSSSSPSINNSSHLNSSLSLSRSQSSSLLNAYPSPKGTAAGGGGGGGGGASEFQLGEVSDMASTFLLWLSLALVVTPLKTMSLHLLTSLPVTFKLTRPLLSSISMSLPAESLAILAESARDSAPKEALKASEALYLTPYGLVVSILLFLMGVGQLVGVLRFSGRAAGATWMLGVGFGINALVYVMLEHVKVRDESIAWVCLGLGGALVSTASAAVFLRDAVQKSSRMMVFLWALAPPVAGIIGAGLHSLGNAEGRSSQLKCIALGSFVLVAIHTFRNMRGKLAPWPTLPSTPAMKKISIKPTLKEAILPGFALGCIRVSRYFFLFWFPEFLQTVFLANPAWLGRTAAFVEYGAVAAAAVLILVGKLPLLAKSSPQAVAGAIPGLFFVLFLFAQVYDSSGPAFATLILCSIGAFSFLTEFLVIFCLEIVTLLPPDQIGALRLTVDAFGNIVVSLFCFVLFRGAITLTWANAIRVCGSLSGISLIFMVPLILRASQSPQPGEKV